MHTSAHTDTLQKGVEKEENREEKNKKDTLCISYLD